MAHPNIKEKKEQTMNLAEFRESLATNTPPAGLPVSLQALWQEAKGDWNAAHELVQVRENEQACNWIHAYLHRKEGDISNATYWYRRAEKPVYKGSLAEEWTEISSALLAVTAK
jgi:hypothetical protein